MERDVPYDWLEPPHIQLGFYWHDVESAVSLRRVSDWLVSRGYALQPPSILVSAADFPFFTSVALAAIVSPHVAIHESVALALPALFANRSRIPVLMQFRSTDPRLVTVNCGFALLPCISSNANERRVVELTVSGADLSLVNNPHVAHLSPATRRSAEVTEAWCRDTFCTLCEEYVPDYAMMQSEAEVYPPDMMATESTFLYWAAFVSRRRSQHLHRSSPAPALIETRDQEPGVFFWSTDDEDADARTPGLSGDFFARAFSAS